LEARSGELGHLIQLTPGELARFHAGDGVIFRRIVEQYSPRLLASVASFAEDADGAHDLLQDAWHRAYQKRSTFSGSGTLLGWLYSVCRNVCLADSRKRSQRASFTLNPEDHAGSGPPGPDRAAEHAALRHSVNEAIMELPDRERDIVVLRMLEQRSTREVAAALGCAEGTIKAALHSALKKLRQSMENWAP
jgi:RNA polymerase sigma-70 factor (ECF subfamily)